MIDWIGKWLSGEKEYTVIYLAIGMMGNIYKVGRFTFTASKTEVKTMGSIPNVGFYKNYKSLVKYYPVGDPMINYKSLMVKSDEED